MTTTPDQPQLVVGAVIVDDLAAPNRVLAARRTRPTELAGMWEFPGGKVESGETPREALAREIREELGVTIDVGTELTHPDGAWPISQTYALRLYFATVTAGTPTPLDSHDALRWLARGELEHVPWLPSDDRALPVIANRLA
ncbi:(deoxy)nucleoside triphosphate pyrophosphohydrolase [Tsukamurella soli]|uniref:8-oxo-dGTP diphosphatase n=1 Tax=Tsukamurella soli TaxID=644556 RepID=A0ABP8KGD4_9ACTN